MKHVGTIIGTAIAGMFVMSVWGHLLANMELVVDGLQVLQSSEQCGL